MQKLSHTQWKQLVVEALNQTTEHYRFGQALFNIGVDKYPVFESIRGGDADPFQALHENDIRVCRCYDHIVDIYA